jgi:hypothetical protein
MNDPKEVAAISTESKAGNAVWERLSALLNDPKRCPRFDMPSKLVIFSDHHRGAKDRADDFFKCQAAYHAALAYYWQLGYTLILLGDVEELLECTAARVIKTYVETLTLERPFFENGRAYRVFGNHDFLWSLPSSAEKHLGVHINHSHIYEGISFRYAPPSATAADVPVDELFLAHGFQGTIESDLLAKWTRPIVYIWGGLQRVFGWKWRSPAEDGILRSGLERIFHDWALTQNTPHHRLIFVAGHTHHPVFASLAYEAKLQEELDELQAQLDKLPASSPQRVEVSDALAKKSSQLQYELARTESSRQLYAQDPLGCYFNTGCCSFNDGDVTGLEIEENEIRLVRWPDDSGAPLKKILQSGILFPART